MTAEQTFTCLLVLGCVPWLCKFDVIRLRSARRSRRSVRQAELQLQALFWRLHVVRRAGKIVSVRISLPLINRLQDAIWATLRQLVK